MQSDWDKTGSEKWANYKKQIHLEEKFQTV